MDITELLFSDTLILVCTCCIIYILKSLWNGLKEGAGYIEKTIKRVIMIKEEEEE